MGFSLSRQGWLQVVSRPEILGRDKARLGGAVATSVRPAHSDRAPTRARDKLAVHAACMHDRVQCAHDIAHEAHALCTQPDFYNALCRAPFGSLFMDTTH